MSFGYSRPRVLSRSLMETAVWAHRVDLTWDQNAEPDLAGYKMYFDTVTGGVSGPGSPKNMGNFTCGSVTVSTRGTWFFRVTAYNQTGDESPPSTEVSGTFT